LQNASRLQNVIVILFAFYDQHDTSSILNLLHNLSIYLKENLFGANISDRFNEFCSLRFGCVWQPCHSHLDHFDLGLLTLASPIH
jgi:hypothetical protein